MKPLFQWITSAKLIRIGTMTFVLVLICLYSVTNAQDDGDVIPDAPVSHHISTLAWSPDGKTIAVGNNVETCNNPLNNYGVRLLNAETLQQIAQLGISHQCSVSDLDWSPDSRYLVASYFGEPAEVWDTSTGKTIATMRFSTTETNENKWSPDGTKIAGIDLGWPLVTIWNPFDSHDDVFEIEVGSTSSVAWSPNGKQIATSNADGLKIWDANTGDLIQTMVARPTSHLVWSPDGKKIASRDDSVVLVWDLASGHISEAFEYHEALVTQIVWSPDSQFLASSSEDGKLLININSENVFEVLRSQSPIDAVAWGPDGSRLAYAGQATGDTVQMIPFTPPPVATAVPDSATDQPYVEAEVYSVKWSPNGKWISVSGGERTCNDPATDSTAVRIFDANTHQLAKKLFGGNCTSTSLDWSPDSQQLVAVNIVRDFAYIWHVESEQLSMTFPLNMQGIGTVAWNPNQNIIAVSSPTNFIAFFDPTTGQRLPNSHHVSGIIGEWSPYGTQIASGYSETGDLDITNITTGETIRHFSGSTGMTYNMDWSKDGSRIAASNTDGLVYLWDALTGEQLANWHIEKVIDVQFSPDGQRLATASLTGKIQVWRVETGALLDTFTNPDRTYSVTWSPDGSKLAYFDKNTSTLHIVEPSS